MFVVCFFWGVRVLWCFIVEWLLGCWFWSVLFLSLKIAFVFPLFGVLFNPLGSFFLGGEKRLSLSLSFLGGVLPCVQGCSRVPLRRCSFLVLFMCFSRLFKGSF